MKCKVMVHIDDGNGGVMAEEYSGIIHYVKSSATREMQKALKMHVNPRIIDFYIKEVE